jgi:hypothetical protein
MSALRLIFFPLLLLLGFATRASAQDDPGSRAIAGIFSPGIGQAVYKGVIGNVLETIPMDPSDRLDLQRTNAVVSNTLLGRTLTTLAGLSNPVLLVGGFAWGMWAASNIKQTKAGVQLTIDAEPSGAGPIAAERRAAILDRSSFMDETPAISTPEPVLVSSISTGRSDADTIPHSHVVKIWLPQRLHRSDPRSMDTPRTAY